MPRVIQTRSTCIEPSAIYPITVDYARLHLKSISALEDSLVLAWIAAATQYFEEQTGRPIMLATWEYWLDGSPVESVVELPHPPLVDVISIEYAAQDGTTVSFIEGSPETALWRAVTPQGTYPRRGWVEPVPGAAWPVVRSQPDAIRIRYEAGYAEEVDEVPELIKAALLLLVAQFDQFRAETHVSEGARLERLPLGMDQMLAGFKYSAYPAQVLHAC